MTSPTEAGARRRALVVGTGLIGGSIALALRRRGWHVSGTDSDAGRLEEALSSGVIDAGGDDPEAEVVFVAVPAGVVASTVAAVLADQHRRPDVVVTDVCGVKAPVVRRAAHPRFIGGHPMAGSEQIGLAGADADLFEGAVWVLTPTESTDLDSFDRLKGIVGSLGADVIMLSPADHDRLVAVVSHVPHLVAATLMNAASDGAEHDATLLRLAAGGFRDMTRVAAGHPGIWPDICAENSTAIVGALDTLLDQLLRHPRPGGRSGPRRAAGRPPAGQRSTTQPAGARGATGPVGRAAHSRAGPGRGPGGDHLARSVSRHRDLRHRDRPLDRGPARCAHPRGRRSGGCRAGRRRRGTRLPVPGRARSREHPSRPGGRGRRGLPRHACARRGRSRSRTVPCCSGRWPRAPRWSAASPTAPTWPPPWPRWRRSARGSSGGADGSVAIHGGRGGCTSPPGRSTAATRAPRMRLLAGLVAGFAWETELVGDDSLSARPMDRVAEPLGLMGARIEGHGRPLHSAAAGPRRGAARHRLDREGGQCPGEVGDPARRALGPAGRRWCARSITTRTHTEEMLAEAGAEVEVEPWGDEGRIVRLQGGAADPSTGPCPVIPRPRPSSWSPAVWSRGATSTVAGVYDGPARLGFVGVLRAHGSVRWRCSPKDAGRTAIRATAGPLRATDVRAAEIPSLDEVPALVVAAAVAEGTSVFSDVGELRVKEVDRLSAAAPWPRRSAPRHGSRATPCP